MKKLFILLLIMVQVLSAKAVTIDFEINSTNAASDADMQAALDEAIGTSTDVTLKVTWGSSTAVAQKTWECFRNALKNEVNNNVTGVDASAIPTTWTYMFQGNKYLTSITLPTAGTELKDQTFTGCTSLTTIVYPEGSKYTSIGSEAFYNCSSLTDLTIPASVRELKINSFNNTPSLATITFEGDTEINFDTDWNNFKRGVQFFFNNSTRYTTKDDTDDGRCYILSKDGTVFYRYSGSSALSLPTTVTTLATNSLLRLSSADGTLDLSDTHITTIQKSLFGTNINGEVSTLILPASVTSIDNDFVSNYPSLTSIKIGTSDPGESSDGHYKSISGLLYQKNADNTYTLVKVPENITSTGLETACAALKTSGITLTAIGNNAMARCKNITAIHLPATVTTFGTHCFDSCTGITTFTLPSELETWGDAPFINCASLTAVGFKDANGNPVTETTHGFFVKDNIIYQHKKGRQHLCLVPSGLTSFNIDPATKVIDAEALAYSQATDVVIPQGVETFESSVFHASKIERLLIPHSVSSGGSIDWFKGCKNLKSITILVDDVDTNNGVSNLFYNTTLDNLKVHISDEADYKGLKQQFLDAKGRQGKDDVGWGDIGEGRYVPVNHRAITESVESVESVGATNLGVENPTYDNTIVEQEYDYLTLYRDFTSYDGEPDGGAYYTLVLPVALTGQDIINTFGPETQVWTFEGRNDHVLHFARHTLTADASSTVVHAGEAFILKPQFRQKSYLFNFTKATRPTGVPATNNEVFPAAGFVKTTQGTGDFAGTTFRYAFQGTFNASAVIPRYAYYVGNNGSVIQNTSTKTDRKFTKALRGFIISQDLDTTPAGAKEFPLQIDLDGVTNAIDDISLDGQRLAPADNRLYNINGQRVGSGSSLQHLPKGVYILNGKKIVVR